jgi:hypothetical protein
MPAREAIAAKGGQSGLAVVLMLAAIISGVLAGNSGSRGGLVNAF